MNKIIKIFISSITFFVILFNPAYASSGHSHFADSFFSYFGKLSFASIIIFILILFFFYDGNALDFLKNIIKGGNGENEEEEENQDMIKLTFPAGISSKVFQVGWTFGAKCIVDGVDVSDEVKWSGSASFRPEIGNRSRPSFKGLGSNTITLTYKGEKKTLTKTYKVEAVSHALYARVGDIASCPSDSHGCPGCPHIVSGPITTGSPNVTIDGKPAARAGDVGVHSACCGAESFKISGATGEVKINGRTAAKLGDTTKHCGGYGTIIQGSSGG